MQLLSDSLVLFPGFLHSLPFSQFTLISQKSVMLIVCCETSSEQSSRYQLKRLFEANFRDTQCLLLESHVSRKELS